MSQVQFSGSWSQCRGCQVQLSQVQSLVSRCPVFQGPESQIHRIPGLRVLGPRVLSHGSRVAGPRVQGRDYKLCPNARQAKVCWNVSKNLKYRMMQITHLYFFQDVVSYLHPSSVVKITNCIQL